MYNQDDRLVWQAFFENVHLSRLGSAIFLKKALFTFSVITENLSNGII